MHGGQDVVVSQHPPVGLVDPLFDLLGARAVALPEQHLRPVAPRARRGEAVGRLPRLEQRERAGHLLLRLVELALRHRDRAERREAPADRGVVARQDPLADRQGALRELLRRVEPAEAAVDAGDGLEKVGLDVRLPAELGLQALAGLVEDLLRGDVAARLLGIGDLEEADQELLDALRAARGGGRVFAFASARFACRAATAIPVTSEARTRTRRRDADAVAAHELREPVAEGVGTRLDGLALAVPAQVAGERRDRRRSAARARDAARRGGCCRDRRAAVARAAGDRSRSDSRTAARRRAPARRAGSAARSTSSAATDASAAAPRPSRFCGSVPVRSS